nr:hypothetical protein [Tanacetum cinerariifolium]
MNPEKHQASSGRSPNEAAMILPQNINSKNTNVIAPRMYKVQIEHNQTRTPQLPQDIRKINKRVSFSTGVIPTTSVSRPQLKSNQLEDSVMPNNSQGKKKHVEDHLRNFKFPKTSIIMCNDSLNASTSNVNFVCVTCGKYVLNDNHDMCVLHYMNGVNSNTKKPFAVPISTRNPTQTVNQSVATSLKKTVATDSTVKKPRNITRKQYEHVSKTSNWWYPMFTPSGYKWKPKSPIVNVKTNLVDIFLFIVDSGCSEHMTGNLKLLTNFMEKFLGTVKFGNDQIASILGYEDLGNDILTGSCGTDLYSITLQDTSSPNLICLMAKAISSQAWLWHRRLSHLNIDTINLLLKYNIVTGLLKLKFIKDHLFSSYHPLEQVIRNPSQSIRTRRQLETDGEMCMFALTVSRTEPKNIKESMADYAWIEAMQKEIHQFKRLVILNGDSPAPTRVVNGVLQPVAPTTTEQRFARKNKLKARGTLLMALPDKH